MTRVIIVASISYLIGSIASAYIVGKVFRNFDIREHGSGNAGATNALRTMGFKLGFLTFILDFSKGVLAALIGSKLVGQNGVLIASIFVVLGHNYPVFLRFRGGKGIATTLGAMAFLHFPIALTSVIVGIIVALSTKYVSLGSLMFLSLNFLLTILPIKNIELNVVSTCFLLMVMGFYRHKSNIKRLINGNENKLSR